MGKLHQLENWFSAVPSTKHMQQVDILISKNQVLHNYIILIYRMIQQYSFKYLKQACFTKLERLQ